MPPPSLVSLVSSLHSAPDINWVRGTIPPSVRDRSPSVSHSSTVKSPADLHTCVHTQTCRGQGASLNYRDMKLTSVNNQSKRKELQTASPANPALSFDQTHMNRQVRFTANGGSTLAYNCLTSARNHHNHGQTGKTLYSTHTQSMPLV